MGLRIRADVIKQNTGVNIPGAQRQGLRKRANSITEGRARRGLMSRSIEFNQAMDGAAKAAETAINAAPCKQGLRNRASVFHASPAKDARRGLRERANSLREDHGRRGLMGRAEKFRLSPGGQGV